MIDKSKAVRVDIEQRIKAGPRRTYILICDYPNCNKEIRIRQDGVKTHSGKCLSHRHVKRPFESIYNSLFRDWRKIEVTLTYEEFLEFTKITQCHYCGESISRVPFGTVDGKYTSKAYFLDRKSPRGPYSKDNCVVCCTECNFIKGNRFEYYEYLVIGTAIQAVKNLRKITGVRK